MARLPQHPEIAPGIVVNYYREMRPPFIVFFDGFNDRCFTCQREVENVTACTWLQTHAIASPALDAVDTDDIEQRFIFE